MTGQEERGVLPMWGSPPWAGAALRGLAAVYGPYWSDAWPVVPETSGRPEDRYRTIAALIPQLMTMIWNVVPRRQWHRSPDSTDSGGHRNPM